MRDTTAMTQISSRALRWSRGGRLPERGISMRRTWSSVKPKDLYMMLPKVRTNSPVRDGRQEGIDHAEPELRIPESFSDLWPRPLDTGNVTSGFVLEDTSSSEFPSVSIPLHLTVDGISRKTYAIRFSSLVIHLTSFGLPSSTKQMSASTIVDEPKKSEMQRQGARPPYFSAWEPMPYITRLAIIPNPALADCQNSAREECSSRLYHEPTTRTKPGEMVHSKKPWSALMAMS